MVVVVVIVVVFWFLGCVCNLHTWQFPINWPTWPRQKLDCLNYQANNCLIHFYKNASFDLMTYDIMKYNVMKVCITSGVSYHMKRRSILLQGSPTKCNGGLYYYKGLLAHEKEVFITIRVSYHMKQRSVLLQGSPTTRIEGLYYYRGPLPHETKVYITTGASYHMKQRSISL